MINRIFFKTSRTITTKHSFGIKYTRDCFRQQIINADKIKEIQRLNKLQQYKKSIYNLKCNDKNPKNFVNVKINDPVMFGYKPPEIIKEPYILFPTPRSPRVLISATRKYMKTSLKKLKVAFGNLKKIHISQAIYFLKKSPKKVAKEIIPTFYNLIDHASRKGLDPLRLYVHGLIIGKTRRMQGVRYHAKGRIGSQTSDICQTKVILYEKPSKQFFRDLVQGKNSLGAIGQIKSQIIISDIPAQTVSKLGSLLTSKGRQQLREIMKRKVDLKMQQNKKLNVFVPKKVLMDEQINYYAAKYEAIIEQVRTRESKLLLREQLYKKNMETN